MSDIMTMNNFDLESLKFFLSTKKSYDFMWFPFLFNMHATINLWKIIFYSHQHLQCTGQIYQEYTNKTRMTSSIKAKHWNGKTNGHEHL